MQIFGLHHRPEDAVLDMQDVHVGSQIRESCQMLYTALIMHGAGITERCPMPTGSEPAYAPHMRGHPCTRWVFACKAHFCWLLEHASALGEEWLARRGKVHKCAHHVEHIKRHMEAMGTRGCPDAMPDTITVDEWRSSLNDKQRKEWEFRIAGSTPPAGCQFGILAMDSEFHVTAAGDGGKDWVASYVKLYAYKESKATVTKLGKRRREDADTPRMVGRYVSAVLESVLARVC